jgi:hypothetical protein
MAINFSVEVYRICQEAFSVPFTCHPIYSQPGGASWEGRGIFDTDEQDVVAEDGSMFVDQQTILDVRIAECVVLPHQKDRIVIPLDCNGKPLGEFEVVSTTDNGGGELTIVLREWKPDA